MEKAATIDDYIQMLKLRPSYCSSVLTIDTSLVD